MGICIINRLNSTLNLTSVSPINLTTGAQDTSISLANAYGDTKNPYGSKTKNYVLASPNGSNGVPNFRALVAADIPSIPKSKISDLPTIPTVTDTYSGTSSNAMSGKAVKQAIDALDVSSSGTGAGKTLSALSQTDDKISATYQNISITKSQVSDFAHAHGSIANAGSITTNATIANNDRLLISDADDSNLIKRTSIVFDGSTTNQFLSKKGTWVNPLGSQIMQIKQYTLTTTSLIANKVYIFKLPAISGYKAIGIVGYAAGGTESVTKDMYELRLSDDGTEIWYGTGYNKPSSPANNLQVSVLWVLSALAPNRSNGGTITNSGTK